MKKVSKYKPPKVKGREYVWRFSSIQAYEQFDKAIKAWAKQQQEQISKNYIK